MRRDNPISEGSYCRERDTR